MSSRLTKEAPRTTTDRRDWHGLIKVGDAIEGRKRFTYAQRSNPWNQLLFMQLTKMPLAEFSWCGQGPQTEVDARYFATQAIPLMRITQQDNQINALADIASFLAFFARVLLDTHFWSFRRPDRPLETGSHLGRREQRWSARPLHMQLR